LKYEFRFGNYLLCGAIAGVLVLEGAYGEVVTELLGSKDERIDKTKSCK
jgi:hypothetical protein